MELFRVKDETGFRIKKDRSRVKDVELFRVKDETGFRIKKDS